MTMSNMELILRLHYNGVFNICMRLATLKYCEGVKFNMNKIFSQILLLLRQPESPNYYRVLKGGQV